jgi:hypothetical protein
MNGIFDPVNQGFIIAALMGFLVLLVASVTVAAPDLLGQEQGYQLPILRLPLLGFLLRLIGIGQVPVLFLLGIYPFIIGIVGWTGNLFCLIFLNFYPSSGTLWWLVRLSGIFVAWVFILIVAKLRKLLTTQTVNLIPERLIGTSGEILAVLGNGVIQVCVYDEIGKFSLHIFCVPWENATELDFAVGNKVYIVDMLGHRHYSIVKLDSADQLKVISLQLPFHN